MVLHPGYLHWHWDQLHLDLIWDWTKRNDTSILLSLSKLIERFTVVYINSIGCTISSVLKVFIVKNFSRRKETEVNSCDFDFF